MSEPCGVERYLIGWYRQELHGVTSGNNGRPTSRIQRRMAWREVQHRVAAWVMYDLADGVTPDPADVRVWQKIRERTSPATYLPHGTGFNNVEVPTGQRIRVGDTGIEPVTPAV